ncbi:MAG: hypothetical protein RJA70_2596, partial [Pseudomonadota bacterium]
MFDELSNTNRKVKYMLITRSLFRLSILSSIVLGHTMALAQAEEKPAADAELTRAQKVEVGVGTDQESLPAPQSDYDPAPAVAAPVLSAQGITEQAGVGGTQAYGRAVVLELGGFGSLISAKNYLSLGINPSIGWFFMDNVEISAILGVGYVSQTVHFDGPGTADANTVDTSTTNLSLLIEPSVHIPFSEVAFGFFGMGFGVSSQYADPGDDPGLGFAIAPRLGMNVMVGRSGV